MIVQARDLSIGHRHFLQEGLNFTMREGEVLLISGSNGSGKTTLLRAILGQQEYILGGRLERAIPLRTMGYLPQIPWRNFPLAVSLKEIVQAFDPLPCGHQLLKRHLLERNWLQASGGERQAVLIAISLQPGIEVLILDEPFNHMDANSVETITAFFGRLLQESILKGLIVVTHTRMNLKTKEVRLR